MWITLNVRAAVEIADRAYVVDGGRGVFSGAAGELAKDEDRVRALAVPAPKAGPRLKRNSYFGAAAEG